MSEPIKIDLMKVLQESLKKAATNQPPTEDELREWERLAEVATVHPEATFRDPWSLSKGNSAAFYDAAVILVPRLIAALSAKDREIEELRRALWRLRAVVVGTSAEDESPISEADALLARLDAAKGTKP